MNFEEAIGAMDDGHTVRRACHNSLCDVTKMSDGRYCWNGVEFNPNGEDKDATDWMIVNEADEKIECASAKKVISVPFSDDPLFKRFSKGSKDLMRRARLEAAHHGFDYIGRMHILLALTTGCGTGAILSKYCSLDDFRDDVKRRMKNDITKVFLNNGLVCTLGVRDVMNHAHGTSMSFCHKYIEPEHILLGLMLAGCGNACQALIEVGLTPEKLLEEIRNCNLETKNYLDEEDTIQKRGMSYIEAVEMMLKGYRLTRKRWLENYGRDWFVYIKDRMSLNFPQFHEYGKEIDFVGCAEQLLATDWMILPDVESKTEQCDSSNSIDDDFKERLLLILNKTGYERERLGYSNGYNAGYDKALEDIRGHLVFKSYHKTDGEFVACMKPLEWNDIADKLNRKTKNGNIAARF
jgi:hypothetical protein